MTFYKLINLIKVWYQPYRNKSRLVKNNKLADLNNLKIAINSVVYDTDLKGDINIHHGCNINNCTIRGRLIIGKYTSINGPGTLIYSKHNNIEVGSYCSIAHNVTIMEFFHNTETLSTAFLNKKLSGYSSYADTWSKGKITIGSDVWIGTGCTILSGVSIGHGAIVGSNSVINKDVPSYSIVAGNPAKVIKYRFEESIIKELLELKWWSFNLEDIKMIEHLLNKKLTIDVVQEIKKILKERKVVQDEKYYNFI